MSQKVLCRVPFDHLFINNLGIVNPCCVVLPQYTAPEKNDIHLGESVLKAGVKAAINSTFMNVVRDLMLEGKLPIICNVCKLNEDREGTSRRVESLSETDKVPDKKPRIKSMDLRLGNICNFKCRMCSPFASAALKDEWVKSPIESMRTRIETFFESRTWENWSENDVVWNELGEYTEHLERINFAGGEPLLNLQHVEFLKKMPLQHKNRIIVTYNTNLSVVPNWFEEIVENFKEVHLQISIDGTPKVNEYIRYGLNSEVFEKNIKKLQQLRHRFGQKLKLSFYTTLQIYNVFDIGKFLTEINKSKNSNEEIRTEINFLNYPEYLDIAAMPESLKQSALEKFENDSRDLDADFRNQTLNQIRSHLKITKKPDEINKFVLFTRHFDQSRKQNILEIVPELTPLFK